MLTNGLDHVASITNDGDRLRQVYVEVFDATIESDGPEFLRRVSVFFRDPDRMEFELLCANPDVDPEDLHFGTPSARYS